jgi:hypothetical protein
MPSRKLPPCHRECEAIRLLKLRVLRFGLLQDGDVGVGVLPEGGERIEAVFIVAIPSV